MYNPPLSQLLSNIRLRVLCLLGKGLYISMLIEYLIEIWPWKHYFSCFKLVPPPSFWRFLTCNICCIWIYSSKSNSMNIVKWNCTLFNGQELDFDNTIKVSEYGLRNIKCDSCFYYLLQRRMQQHALNSVPVNNKRGI